MDDVFRPVAPWIGMLDAFGVALVALLWLGLRNGTGFVRSAAAAFGAVFVFSALATRVGMLASSATVFTTFPFEVDGGRRVLDVLLLVTGLAVGVAAVLFAHRRAAEAAEDLADDARLLAALDADETDDAERSADPYTVVRRRWVGAAPWLDVAALAVALSVPVAVGRPFVGHIAFGAAREVTVTAAFYHLVLGVVAAAPLLVVARRAAGHPVVLGGLALVAIRVVALPAAPGFFANEFWAAFGIGLSAGLALAAVWGLLTDVVPIDRNAALRGAVAALAVLVASAGLGYRVAVETQRQIFEDQRLPDDIGDLVPELPDFPTGFPPWPG